MAQTPPVVLLRALILLAPLWAAMAWASPAITLQFMEQMPTSGVDAQGRPQGELVERMRRVEQLAGLRLRWQLAPLKRSLQELRDNREPVCALGVYRSAEREAIARFSRPLLAGVPQVLVARREAAARLRQLPSARAAVQSAELRLLVFDGVSYGEEIDAWIAERRGPTLRAVAGPLRIVEMLSRDRADFAIMTARGLEQWRRDGIAGAEGLEIVATQTLPPPPARHIACSKRVDEAWMRQLDQAIESLDRSRS